MTLLGTTNTNPYIGAWTATFTKFATQAGMRVTNLSSNYDAACNRSRSTMPSHRSRYDRDRVRQ